MNTAVGANSQATAAHGPPSRSRAAAATAEPARESTTPVTWIGMPTASPSGEQRGQTGEEGHQGAVRLAQVAVRGQVLEVPDVPVADHLGDRAALDDREQQSHGEDQASAGQPGLDHDPPVGPLRAGLVGRRRLREPPPARDRASERSLGRRSPGLHRSAHRARRGPSASIERDFRQSPRTPATSAHRAPRRAPRRSGRPARRRARGRAPAAGCPGRPAPPPTAGCPAG